MIIYNSTHTGWHTNKMSPHACQINENKIEVCFRFNLRDFFLLSFGKRFTAQFHQKSFHPNIVVMRVPRGCFFLGESQNVSYFSLCLSSSLLFHSFHSFIF